MHFFVKIDKKRFKWNRDRISLKKSKCLAVSVEECLVLAKIVSRVRFKGFTQAMLKIGYRNCHIQYTLFVEKWLVGSYFFSR